MLGNDENVCFSSSAAPQLLVEQITLVLGYSHFYYYRRNIQKWSIPPSNVIENIFPKCHMGFDIQTKNILKDILKKYPICTLLFDEVNIIHNNGKATAYVFLLQRLLSKDPPLLIGVAQTPTPKSLEYYELYRSSDF